MKGARFSDPRLRDDDRGATIVEFALVVGPMLLLLLGGLELAYNSYVRSTMQGALNDAARRAAVEYPVIDAPGSDVGEQVANLIEATVKHVAPYAQVTVDPQGYSEFSSIRKPEKLIRDINSNGRFDAADDDCWEDVNRNGRYDSDARLDGMGGASDVVFYEAKITAPRILPLHHFLPGVGPMLNYNLKTAVRNQPYRLREAPPTPCGLD